MKIIRIVQKAGVISIITVASLYMYNVPLRANERTCVTTDNGTTVCGTSTNSSSQTQEYPTQVTTEGGVTWELKSCNRKKYNIVSCTFSITNSRDELYVVTTSKDYTKIVDTQGNEYYVGKIQQGKKVGGAGLPINSGFGFNVVQNIPYILTIDFNEVPDSVSQLSLFQAIAGAGWSVKFRNLPIVNLDGSFTVVPTKDRPSANTQPVNNTIPKPKVCLPVVGCL
ncbi:hypothetical protein [Nostoc sp. FACHB-110]|uniref:hypothetical protein n=1 Tax=Nostoc sp. FACHB-110 TaxID=2692834 RepID=UPI001689E41D|nr:hypothetical protein [Nostoc sp. FACHB-110]MBD2441304.1 hypothetical protein [Nostoc sp. FACHB-110]